MHSSSPVNVWELLAELWVYTGLLQCQGHWQQQSWEEWCVGISLLGEGRPWHRDCRLQDWATLGQISEVLGPGWCCPGPRLWVGHWVRLSLKLKGVRRGSQKPRWCPCIPPLTPVFPPQRAQYGSGPGHHSDWDWEPLGKSQCQCRTKVSRILPCHCILAGAVCSPQKWSTAPIGL